MQHTGMCAKSIFLIFLALFFSVSAFSEEPKRNVMVITMHGVINPVASEYIGKNIKKANEKKVEALVIELDTPGGLDTSMRTIVKDIIGSEVPVVVFVSPSGSRAASAGVFIMLAANVAAMAPGTNIGAAHPVGIGEKIDKVMAEKATNDAAAYIKSLAERSGRNAKWAEDAVRKSISATEEEALKKNVIDLVSKDLNTLLSDINGRKVRTVIGEKILNTANTTVIREEMGIRHRILNLISDPNIAY
ncbi:MAG: nodulation protein NfeD, partial [Nitrospirota bacterium]|nr:nodulation protein NfeD [Nitrospirota bacterium]